MFTGLVDGIGEVLEFRMTSEHAHLSLKLPYAAVQAGESIAVNGVCLTALTDSKYQASFDISSETLAVTNLVSLQKGMEVNCERAVLAHTRMGGHVVTGHVDTKASVISLESSDDYVKLCVGHFSKQESLYIIKKGCVALDGVSLTINRFVDGVIELMLVPHTLQNTHFLDLKVGQILNVEFDYMTRTIAHQLQLMLADSDFKKTVMQD